MQLANQIGPTSIYNFMTQKLHFTLNSDDQYSLGGMGIGGLTDGVTVRDMVAAYQIFGNGGQYYEPYTYYYVLDHDGNRILDNTNKIGEQAISSANATILQKLLREPIYASGGTGTRAQNQRMECLRQNRYDGR